MLFRSLHQQGLELGVRPRRRVVDQPAPRRVQQKIRGDHDEHPDGGDPQGVHRPIGDDPVVDVHREKRHRQGEDVSDRRGGDDVPIEGAVLGYGAPEPIGAPVPLVRGGALVEVEHRLDVEGVPGVPRLLRDRKSVV